MRITSTATPLPAPIPLRPGILCRTERLPRADADMLRAALAATGTTIAALAAKVGVSASRAGCWTSDATSEASIPLRYILAAPAAVRHELGRALLATDSPASTVPPVLALALLGRDFGELCAAVTEAGADIDAAEWDRIEREAADIQERCAALRAARRAGK